VCGRGLTLGIIRVTMALARKNGFSDGTRREETGRV